MFCECGEGSKIVLVAESGLNENAALSNATHFTGRFDYDTVGQKLTTEFGTLTLNEDLTFTFTANSKKFDPEKPRTLHYNYIVEDADGNQHRGVLAFDVTGSNPPLQLVDDFYEVAASEVGEDAGTVSTESNYGGVLDNDRDGGASSSVVVVGVSGFTGEGTLGTALQGKYGTLTLNADGSFNYQFTCTDEVPSALSGADLHDTFTYRAHDGYGQEAEASVTFETLLDEQYLWQRDIFTHNDLPDII